MYFFFLQLTFVPGPFVSVAGQVYSGVPDASIAAVRPVGQIYTGAIAGEIQT